MPRHHRITAPTMATSAGGSSTHSGVAVVAAALAAAATLAAAAFALCAIHPPPAHPSTLTLWLERMHRLRLSRATQELAFFSGMLIFVSSLLVLVARACRVWRATPVTAVAPAARQTQLSALSSRKYRIVLQSAPCMMAKA